MKCDVQNLGDGKKQLSIKLSDTEYQEQAKALVAELSKDVELPGFRKGKVPPEHLRAHLGEDKVRADTIGRSINRYLVEAIETQDLDVIAVSEINTVSEDPVEFTAVLELRPELKLKGYEKLEVKIPPVLPSPAEIKEIQANYLKSFGELNEVSRNSMKGDHLTIDLRATYNGEEVEGMNVSDYVYELGSASALKEMDKELEGKKVGDILEFNAQHQTEAGNMRVKVLVKKIQENKIPELDDDLAKKVSEFETADEFREDMLSQIAESKRHNLWHLLQERILDELAKLVPDPLSPALIAAETESIKRRLVDRGANIEEINNTAFESQIKEQAISSTKIDLGLRAVARQEKIKVEESEVQKSADEIKKQITADLEPNIEAIRFSLLRQNTLLWLIERAIVKDDNNLEIDIEELKPKEKEDTEKEGIKTDAKT